MKMKNTIPQPDAWPDTPESINRQGESRLSPSLRSQSGGERRPDVESWLLDLGLKAVQVEHCPIPDCEACAPVRRHAA